jgi:hypothetical protein
MNGKPPTEKAAGPDSFSVEECSSGFLPEESEKKKTVFLCCLPGKILQSYA